jgi:hypothetical protein
MKVVIGLLVLLTIAMLVGVVRKLRGDTFFAGARPRRQLQRALAVSPKYETAI